MKWIKMSVNMQSFRPKEMKTYTILSSISFEYVKIQCINRYGCLLVKWLLYVLNNVMMTRKTTTTKGTSAAATSNRKRDTTFTIWFVWEKKKGTVVNGHYTALHLISNQLKAVAILRRYRHFFFSSLLFLSFSICICYVNNSHKCVQDNVLFLCETKAQTNAHVYDHLFNEISRRINSINTMKSIRTRTSKTFHGMKFQWFVFCFIAASFVIATLPKWSNDIANYENYLITLYRPAFKITKKFNLNICDFKF